MKCMKQTKANNLNKKNPFLCAVNMAHCNEWPITMANQQRLKEVFLVGQPIDLGNDNLILYGILHLSTKFLSISNLKVFLRLKDQFERWGDWLAYDAK